MRKRILLFIIILGLSNFSMLFAQTTVTGGATVSAGTANAAEFEIKVNGEEFFPIGWYNTTTPQELEDAYNAGANISLAYWSGIWSSYSSCSYSTSTSYNIFEYKRRLKCYLDEIEDLNNNPNSSHKIRALIDLDLKEQGNFGFNKTNIVDLVTEIEANYSDEIFGWYVLDEPTQNTDLTVTPHPRVGYHDITSAIRDTSDLPIVIVFANPEAFDDYKKNDSTIFEGVHYDILGRDSYLYQDEIVNSNNTDYLDENNLSRVVSKRAVKLMQDYENGLILDQDTNLTRKMAYMFVGMIHDQYAGEDFLDLTKEFILYESMAPIIEGARAMLYYWWHPTEASNNAKTWSTQFVTNFTNTYKLDNIILKGEVLDNSLSVTNFKLNGEADFLDDYIWKTINNTCQLPGYTACSTGLGEALISEEPMFNWIVRKYNGSYYIIAVNNYDPTVTATLNLGNVLDTDEMVYQITELDMFDPSQNTQINFTENNKIKTSGSAASISSFNTTFSALDVKVYKIDVLKMTSSKSISGISYNTLGGGVTTAFVDSDTKPDILVMSIEDDAQADEMQYRLCWDLSFSVTGVLSCTYHGAYSPNIGYGTFPGIAWDTKGGDIEAYLLGGTSNRYELFSLGVNNSTGNDDFRVKLKWDMSTSGYIYATDNSYTNFPGDGRLNVGTDSDLITGAGIDVTNVIGTDPSKPEIFVMYIQKNASGSNTFKYYIVKDFTSLKSDTASHSGITGPYSAGTIGWETNGGDIAVGDIDNDGTFEMIFMGIEEPTNENRIIIKNLNSSGIVEGTWRPHSNFTINSFDMLSTGIDLEDVDNDGDLDLVVMGLANQQYTNNFYVTVGVNGLISNGNNPFSTPASKVLPDLNDESEEDLKTEVPSEYTLEQNYPNPFNPTTTISYSILNNEFVTLEVFDIQGRLVSTLVSEQQTPGTYSKTFDASNFSSGIYLYRITTNSFTQTKKLTLIK